MEKVMAARRVPLKASTGSALVGLGRSIRSARKHGEFAEFCATHLIHTRKGYDLIVIADAVDAGRLTPNDVTEIGWSKARLIAAQATNKLAARNAVRFARHNILPAVVAYFQQDGAATPLVTKSFHLSPQQASELEAALLRAGGLVRGGRLQNRSHALMTIVRNFQTAAHRRNAGKR